MPIVSAIEGSNRTLGAVHVGLNLVYLVPGETGGMEVYARELIAALRAERPELRLTLFVNREAAEAAWTDLPSVTVPVRARRRAAWVLGEQLVLPRLAARAGVDVLHSLGSTAPARGRFRRVTTIHDLIYRLAPEAHGGLNALGMRVLVPLAARRSHRILTGSRHSARDLERLLGVPAGRIDVVPHGFGAPVRPEVEPEGELRTRLGLGDRRVVLSVGAKRAHKNLASLIEALALIPAERRPVAVMPGYPTPHEDELRRLAAGRGVSGDVRLLGWASDATLEGLYALAAAAVVPSRYEGFGLPVLEAMARGVPVACSDRSSLPEVTGDAALHFDPDRPPAIAAAITRLLEDGALAARLRDAGRARAAGFTWAQAARGTLASYERALAV
jgi:glycosyltransferase involved in cell wall biosynthesis